MAPDELGNGSRYVTHVYLAEVMREHTRDEASAREAMGSRMTASIDRRARAEDLTRTQADVSSLETTVGLHDDRWQQMVGMVSLAKIALGTSVVGTIASLVAIVAALR